MIPIVPAIIPHSALEIRTLLTKLTFSPEVHLDVVDGRFVPFTSWPYEPKGVPAEIRQATDAYTLEVDLMVEDPIPAALTWILAGADMLVFHVESISLADFREFVDTAPSSISIGVSALNSTSLEELRPYLAIAETIQLMGIAEIGAQGQPFDERVLERCQILKREFPLHPITIDGSVNEATVRRLCEAGADRLICGSAIVKAENPKLAYDHLQSLLN